MKTNKFLGCLGIMALAATLAACGSDSNDDSVVDTKGYVHTTDGGLSACSGILFNEDGTDNPDGTQIGNGEQGFVFKGNTTLKKVCTH